MVEVFPRGWTGLSFSVPFPLTGSGPTRPVGLCWGSAPSLGILLRGGQRAPPPGGGRGSALHAYLLYGHLSVPTPHLLSLHCTPRQSHLGLRGVLLYSRRASRAPDPPGRITPPNHPRSYWSTLLGEKPCPTSWKFSSLYLAAPRLL